MGSRYKQLAESDVLGIEISFDVSQLPGAKLSSPVQNLHSTDALSSSHVLQPQAVSQAVSTQQALLMGSREGPNTNN